MKAIYGQKLGMMRVFNKEGNQVPVTVLSVEDNVIQQVKTKETDGYSAVQVGVGTQKAQRLNKPISAHVAKAKSGTPFKLKELRKEEVDGLNVGDKISIDEMFSAGDKVDVRGVSIGKGFAGVMKRHGMKGFCRTHGTHEYFRHGGSIGNRKFPGRVFKNKRMSGHMGSETVLQEGLEVVEVRAEDKLLLVKGSVPGAKKSYVLIRECLKARSKQ